VGRACVYIILSRVCTPWGLHLSDANLTFKLSTRPPPPIHTHTTGHDATAGILGPLRRGALRPPLQRPGTGGGEQRVRRDVESRLDGGVKTHTLVGDALTDTILQTTCAVTERAQHAPLILVYTQQFTLTTQRTHTHISIHPSTHLFIHAHTPQRPQPHAGCGRAGRQRLRSGGHRADGRSDQRPGGGAYMYIDI
jgi:hypothetical protein